MTSKTQNPYLVIENILMTEKSNMLTDLNDQYLFKVNRNATKIDVLRAIEEIYDVKVKKVNMLNRKGKLKRAGRVSLKQGRTAAKKYAIVTLSEGTISVL